MKKLLRYLLMTVMTVCFSLSCLSAEAATVALLPLINNVQGDEVATQVFYKEAINAMNAQKGFMMVENDRLTAVIEAVNAGENVPKEAAAAKIAKDGNVDIVIAMQLDKIEDETLFSSSEDKIRVNIKGKVAFYNRLTSVYSIREINEETLTPEVFSSRWDLPHEEWGKVVRKEIKRALSAKK
ncbi:MAG: hypothetical protein IKV70_06180 [Phascolarctobacterium sp.]|nr:hypothetical protein [Phascolarctobacterium sp.]